MKRLSSDVLTKKQLVDGVWHERTLNAVESYQVGNGLLYGVLTLQVLEHLEVFEADNS